jgi:hypothetical protein
LVAKKIVSNGVYSSRYEFEMRFVSRNMGLKHCVYRKGSSYVVAIRGLKTSITQKGLSELLTGEICCETGSPRSAFRKLLGGDVFKKTPRGVILKKLRRGSKKGN